MQNRHLIGDRKYLANVKECYNILVNGIEIKLSMCIAHMNNGGPFVNTAADKSGAVGEDDCSDVTMTTGGIHKIKRQGTHDLLHCQKKGLFANQCNNAPMPVLNEHLTVVDLYLEYNC
jgi:hypothetical protein